MFGDILCVKGYINFDNLYTDVNVYRLLNIIIPKNEYRYGYFQIQSYGDNWWKLLREVVLEKQSKLP